MTDYFSKIGDSARLLVELVSESLNVDAELVDGGMNRVCATGAFAKKDAVMADGLLYQVSFKEKTRWLIQNPRKNRVCVNCRNRKRCMEKLELSCPVFYGGEVIGCIGVSCPNYESKERFVGNIGANLNFIEKICGLIGVITAETQPGGDDGLAELLKEAINKSGQSIIIEDRDKSIIYISERAKKGLTGKQNRIGGKLFGSEVREGTKIFIDSAAANPKTGESADIRPMRDVEFENIINALDIFGHDTNGKRKAAEMLGIGIATLYRKINEYN